MSKKAEHTPGPWVWRHIAESCEQLEGNVEYPAMNPILTPYQCPACAERGAKCLQPSDADRDYIVRACNSHDALLAACEAAEDTIAGGSYHNAPSAEMCRAAIALAKKEVPRG